MAFGFHQKADQEKIIPSIASSISTGDDKFITSSMYSSASSIFGLARTKRTFSQDESASTESGDDDFSSVQSISVSLNSKDSEASDDDKSLTPRSTDVNVSTCIYSVLFLLNMRAACCGRSAPRNALGYGTEIAPKSEASTPVSSPSSRSSPKSAKALKQRSKAFERPPQQALPVSTADSWIVQQRVAKAIHTGDDDAKVLRAIRSILNKLTIEKFENLLAQLVECGIKTPCHVSMLMSEVFDKATTQHQFIPMYAELCVRLERDRRIASAVKQAGNQHNFRRLLLDQCQKAFEQLLEPCDTAVAIDEDTQIRRKQQALGNVKLVGELLVQGMLSSVLFVECSKMLLQNRKTCPEALECLASLVMVAGPKFDVGDWQHHSGLETILANVDELTRDKSTPPRLRFLLRDVLDARKAGWSANQASVKAAPMKLEEVREKAAEEHGPISPKRQSFTPSAPLPVGLVCRGASDNSKVTVKSNKQKSGGSRKQSNGSSDSGLRASDVVSAFNAHRPQRQIASNAQVKEIEIVAPSEETASIPSPSQTSVENQVQEFTVVDFRRALASTISKLALDKNVPAAVQYIRLQEVPIEFQADEFCDIISRIVEEKRGAVRRCELAFAAGLMATEQSPFDRAACLRGIGLFFQDVYAELCTEVPRLPAIIRSEFVPTMSAVYGVELNKVLPEEMRV